VAGSRRHRVVDADQGQGAQRVALPRRGVHLRDALFQGTAGERDPERVLLVAGRVLLRKTLRAGVLLALVAIDAVVDLAADLARAHPRVGELEAVAAALVLLVAREESGVLRIGPLEGHQLLEVERPRQPQ